VAGTRRAKRETRRTARRMRGFFLGVVVWGVDFRLIGVRRDGFEKVRERKKSL